MGQRVSGLGWRLPVIGVSIVALLLAGFAAGIAARSAFAQPNGTTIYACKGERSGSVRLLEGPGTCNRGEVLVTWNTIGPAGPQGPQGEPGPPGQGSGLPGYSLVEEDIAPFGLLPRRDRRLSIACPPGAVVLSGGWHINESVPVIAVESRRRASSDRNWDFTFFNADDRERSITATLSVLCATPAT